MNALEGIGALDMSLHNHWGKLGAAGVFTPIFA